MSEIKKEIRGWLRSIRLDTPIYNEDDPFVIYQNCCMTKSRLLEIITDELLKGFKIEVAYKVVPYYCPFCLFKCDVIHAKTDFDTCECQSCDGIMLKEGPHED